MVKSKSQTMLVPSASVGELFSTLSAMPRMTHCRKCGHELLHMDATFFLSSGESRTLPWPFCPQCIDVADCGKPRRGENVA